MKTLPFNLKTIQEIISKHPTPFHIYDEQGIKSTSQNLNQTFSWAPGFINYFAVKVLPNPAILRIAQTEGMGVDCSSMAELILAEQAGFRDEQIMFTSNNTSAEEFIKASQLGAIINLDDVGCIDFLESAAGKLPELLCFRYNPGPERTGNSIIGDPSESKFGITREQLFDAYRLCLAKGVKRFGLHTMLVSNELDSSYFIETARMLFELAVELKQKLNIQLEFVNLGGGFGIPYLPEQKPLDVAKVSAAIKNLYSSILEPRNLRPKLFLECGRYVTGPHGYLISRVLHVKATYRNYAGLDATMANLMRPGIYGSYHHITVLGKEVEPRTVVYDIVGSLCENNDKFAIQRSLPELKVGDLVVLHDTGAHGHSMGFNYNGKLRSAELVLQSGGSAKLIRRAETLDDYFATLVE